MDYVSITFLIFAVVTILAFHAWANSVWRSLVMAASNVVFIVAYASTAHQLGPLALFLVAGYMGIRLMERWPSRFLIAAVLVVFLGSYVYLKQYTIVEFLPKWGGPYVVVGFSYILFRVIHIIVDTYQGALKKPLSLIDLFNYCCSFLTFPTGPIARVEDFPRGKQLADLSVSRAVAYEAFSRIVNGYIKVVFVSALFDFYHIRCMEWMAQFHSSLYLWPSYALASMTYMLYLYWNFSGYIDIVIGLGRLFGFSLPENFDRPLSSANFLDLWSRWHITLSEWFKFYVFNPIVKGLTRRWNTPHLTPYIGVLSYFCTFLLMGIWHGSTPAFVIYGILLGFGVSANKLYEIEMRKRLGKARFKGVRENGLYQVLARGLSLSYFCIALTCLWMDFARLSEWAEKLGVMGLVAALLVCTLAFAGVRGVWLTIRRIAPSAPIGFPTWSDSFVAGQLWLACRAFFVTAVLFGRHLSVPEIVYKAF